MIATKHPTRAPGARTIVRVGRWQPTKRFAAWVRAYTIYGLHRSLGVSRRTIYGWLQGSSAPREDNVRAMMLLSRHHPHALGPLSYEDIYGVPEPM